MKVFQIQLKNPNHPTGTYRRDGELFQLRRKMYAQRISEVIANDRNLKISIIESAKDMQILKSVGKASLFFSYRSPEEKDKKPEQKEKNNTKSHGFLGLGKKTEAEKKPEAETTIIVKEE